jgi:class 3 adenylate cyclase
MAPQAHTFIFADLVGFTSLTALHGDEAAADVAVRFAERAADLSTLYGAEVVKTLGDAVLIRGSDPSAAVALALALQEEIDALEGFPAVHIGVATGPAVRRGRDWYGATVNLASRVADSARAAEVLVTEGTLAACGELEDVQVRNLGPQLYKNMVASTVVFAAERRLAEAGRLVALRAVEAAAA